MIALTLAMVLGAAPQVSSVVVYPDRATVTRSLAVQCAGTSTVTFESIPPAADASTVRAKARGATVEGLVTREEITPTAFSPEQDSVRRQLDQVNRELTAEQQAITRAQALSNAGARYAEVALTEISEEMTEAKPNLKAWSTALDVSLQTRNRSVAQLVASSAKIRDLQRKQAELQRKLEQLAPASQTRRRNAEVVVACRSGQATVELSYVVGGARWVPVYEARVDEAAGKLELVFHATVTQATGEDWKGSQVALSTAVPADVATIPELVSLKVYAHEEKEKKKVLVRRDELREHAESGAQEESAFVGQVRPASQGLSVQLEVPGRVDVPGDGRAVRLTVGKHRMNAKLTLKTAPKLVPVVFRVVEATNSAPFPLLPGRLELFGKSGFIGVQPQERVAQGAPLKVTLGTEQGLKVERVVVEELKKAEGLFNSHKRFRYVYRFDLTNNRPKAETLELSEHVPVSELDDVKVELEKDKTTRGYDHQLADGVVTWKLQLAPGETRKVDLAFHIDVPTSYDSGGL